MFSNPLNGIVSNSQLVRENSWAETILFSVKGTRCFCGQGPPCSFQSSNCRKCVPSLSPPVWHLPVLTAVFGLPPLSFPVFPVYSRWLHAAPHPNADTSMLWKLWLCLAFCHLTTCFPYGLSVASERHCPGLFSSPAETQPVITILRDATRSPSFKAAIMDRTDLAMSLSGSLESPEAELYPTTSPLGPAFLPHATLHH